MEEEKYLQINVEEILKARLGKKYKRIPAFLIRYLKKIIHQEDNNTFLKEKRFHKDLEFVDDIINFSNKNFLQSIFKDSASNTGVVFSLKDENSAIELKNLYEKLLLEKDLRIKAIEELIIELKSCK